MARLNWTLEQRTVLHVLRSKFSFSHEGVASIFNRKFVDELRAAGYAGGMATNQLRDEYNSRHSDGRSKMWNQITASQQSDEEEESRAQLLENIQEHADALGLDYDVSGGRQAVGSRASRSERDVNPAQTTIPSPLAVVGDGISALANRGIFVPVKTRPKKRATAPPPDLSDDSSNDSTDDSTDDSDEDGDMPAPPKRVKALREARRAMAPASTTGAHSKQTGEASPSSTSDKGKGKAPVRDEGEMDVDIDNIVNEDTQISGSNTDNGAKERQDFDEGLGPEAGSSSVRDEKVDDDQSADQSEDSTMLPAASVTAAAASASITAGSVGTGWDGAPLFKTAHVSANPNQIWHDRGGGRWAQGIPPKAMPTTREAQGGGMWTRKTHLRIPPGCVTRQNSDRFINKGTNDKGYWTITGDNIENVFADPSNVQFNRI